MSEIVDSIQGSSLDRRSEILQRVYWFVAWKQAVLHSAGPSPDPLSSLGVRRTLRPPGPNSATSCPVTRPFVLRDVRTAQDREVPAYTYDPQRQIVTDQSGAPLAPTLKKDWTTIEGTHTDGDGGDNETYDWEEV